jgi:hypothetical protein
VRAPPLDHHAATIAFFIGSLALIPLLPTGFIPPDDNSQTQVYLELPPGSTLAQTRRRRGQARVMGGGTREEQCTPPLAAARPGPTRLPCSGNTETRKATLTIQLARTRRAPAQARH